jgi:hypothetical protein
LPLLFLLPRGVRNLAGLTFGELTPYSIVEIVPGEGALWQCSCSCGGTRQVVAHLLIAGRVKRCESCARERRTLRLIDAKRKSVAARDSNSDYQRNWRAHVARMTTGQRAELGRLIAGRRRVGVEITEAVMAGLVEVVMIETRAAA